MKMVVIRTTATCQDGWRSTYEEVVPFADLKKMGYPENEIRPFKGTLDKALDIDGEDHFIHTFLGTTISSDECPPFLQYRDEENTYYNVDVKIVDETPKYIPLNKGK